MGVNRYTGLWVGSIIFVVVWLVVGTIVSMYVKRNTKDRTMASSNSSMAFWLTFMGTFCCWVMWICTFMHQMNPLIAPTIQVPTDWPMPPTPAP